MRTILLVAVTVAAFLVAPHPATAHFLWLKVDPAASDPVVRVYFGETPEPGEPDLIARIARTTLQADGMPVEVAKAEGYLEAKLPKASPTTVQAFCDYGVITKKGPAFLLNYHARTQTRPAKERPAEDGDDRLRLEWISQDGQSPTVRAVWRGKPVANETVKVFSDEDGPSEMKTDGQGRVSVSGIADGRVSLLVKVVEATPGKRDGREYAEIRHYATLTVSPMPNAAPAESPMSADDVLKRAHDARATWGPNFPGFTADIAVRSDGEAVAGKVAVSSAGAVKLDLPEGPAKDWARAQLRSLVMHRGLDGPTQLEPGAKFLEPESDHPLGRLIRLPDDRMGSAYRIKGDEIREVNRSMKDNRFSNRVLALQRNAEGKLLPSAFTVTYWENATGKLQRTETFHDTWTRVGRLDLPKAHTQIVSAEEKSPVRQLELSNHRLGDGEPRTASPERD